MQGGFVGAENLKNVGVVVYYAAGECGEVCAEMESIIHKVRSVSVRTVVDDVSI